MESGVICHVIPRSVRSRRIPVAVLLAGLVVLSAALSRRVVALFLLAFKITSNVCTG